MSGAALAAAVGGAGGIGAVTRYLTDSAVRRRITGTFPYGTLVVNVAGSLLLGVVTGLVLFHAASGRLDAIAGVGFCGGLTTWSTASFETVRLAEEGQTRLALANAVGSLGASCVAAAIGLGLAAL